VAARHTKEAIATRPDRATIFKLIQSLRQKQTTGRFGSECIEADYTLKVGKFSKGPCKLFLHPMALQLNQPGCKSKPFNSDQRMVPHSCNPVAVKAVHDVAAA